MRKSLRMMIALIALSVVFGCVIVSLAQNRPIVGGYKVAPTDDPEVVAAAEFAASAQGEKEEGTTIKLLSVEKAERQVVAGINYRLCLRVGIGDDPEDVDVKVVVFRSLQKQYSLKSWDVETCSEPAQDEDPNR